jgi:hypothetical protein
MRSVPIGDAAGHQAAGKHFSAPPKAVSAPDLQRCRRDPLHSCLQVKKFRSVAPPSNEGGPKIRAGHNLGDPDSRDEISAFWAIHDRASFSCTRPGGMILSDGNPREPHEDRSCS